MSKNLTRVSVVIPAYNAAKTLAETLTSICSQTHSALEIIIVDDGSTDETARIAQIFAEQDNRIVVVHQLNAGVAAARNAGIAVSTAEFIAPCDADDLWHPLKIERQLEAFDSRDDNTGLVYTWYALIDEDANIVLSRDKPMFEGNVFPLLARYNFIGNGSSPLIRRAALDEAGGYDTSLRLRGGQGCEDWKLYMTIAARHGFAVVPSFLTGYRLLPGNMSSDLVQMLRSQDLLIQDFLPHHPQLESAFRAGRNKVSRHYVHLAVTDRKIPELAKLIMEIGKYDLLFLLTIPVSSGVLALRRMGAWFTNHWAKRDTQSRRFLEITSE